MLEQSLKTELKNIFSDLQSEYTLYIEVDANHEYRNELVEMLDDVASCSDKIKTEITNGIALKFEIKKDNISTGIIFRAIPNGHEFTSLLLAILNLDGKGKNIPDSSISNRVKALKGDINITTYVSLSCTNCPDVVQALNAMVTLNPNIKHTTVDGALYQDEVDSKGVKAVPSVFLNGELLHVGRSDFGALLSKLEAKVDSEEVVVSTEDQIFDLLVIGGGPAGAAAAIYSARKGLSVAIIADVMGGQVKETVGIENLISTPKTTGQELSSNLMTHIADYPISILEYRCVESMVIDGLNKRITTKRGEVFVAPAVIISTGASWRRLNVPGEVEYIGKGVAFCPHCDGPFYKDKNIAVIGGGNSGIEAAIDLAGIAKKVTVIEFLEQLKADKVLQDKLASLPNVEVILNTQTKEVKGDGSKVTSIELTNRANGEVSDLPLDGIFVQIGLTPNSQPFTELVETTKIGEIVIDSHCRTSISGVYAAGDVSSVPYKQIIIAMGEGAKAALTAFDDRIRGEL